MELAIRNPEGFCAGLRQWETISFTQRKRKFDSFIRYVYIWVYLEDQVLVDLYKSLESAFKNLSFDKEEWKKLDEGLFCLKKWSNSTLERVWVND